MVTKRLNYIVPDETEDGQTIIYADSDNDAMCAECCNYHHIVPFDVIIAPDYDGDGEPYECAYCGELFPDAKQEADFDYDAWSDHDRYYIDATCKVCKEQIYQWEDDNARDFAQDFLPMDYRKWKQPIWEFLNDNNLLHYH